MKKIFILLSILFVGKISAQVFAETFGNGTPDNGTWDLTTNGDFSFQSSSSIYTVCTVSGSSAQGFLVGEDFGTTEEAKVSFSTIGWAAMTLQWNGLRKPGAPTLVVEMSADGGNTYSPLAFTDVTTDGAWHAVTSIAIPAMYEGLASAFLKFSYTATGGNNVISFDDITVSGTGSPIYYWDGSGALQNVNSWWTNIGGTGSHPSNFSGLGQSFIMGPGGFTSATLTGTWTVNGTGSKVILNDGTNPFKLTLSATSTLVIGASTKLNVLNNSTLTLQNVNGIPAIATLSLSTGSTVEYNQATLTNLYNMTYHNLVISGSADKVQTADITVNGNLNIAAGRSFSMNVNPSKTLTLNGTISGSGTLRTNAGGTGGSNLNIGGSGAFGTINFAAGNTAQLNNFTINRTSPGTGILLGTNLTVSLTSQFTNGLLKLNGKLLTLNGATTFGSGLISGSLTSSITVAGTSTGGLLMDQTSSTTKALKDLTVNNASANLALGNAMEVWGAATPSVGTITTGGFLTIKQDATNKGRIGIISTGGFSGNVTVEAYAPGPNTGWALLGVNGLSGRTMNDWYGQFPMAIEGSATGVTSAGGYFESVQGWNEADAYGYDTTITIATALTPGKGFWTYLGTGATTTSDIYISVTGAPVTGSTTINLTKSAQTGTNLIANPYASPISWTALRNGNSAVTNAVYIYNADGPYASFVGGVGTNGGSDILPAGQGFFVEALSNTSLVADETNKVASNTNLMKTTNSTSVGLPIKLQISGFSGEFDETAIRFHGSATNAYDNDYDAHKIFQTPGYVGYPGGYSKYTTISTKGGNVDYSINSIPYALTQNAVIPVLVKVMASGQYTINGFDMQLLPPGACVTLKDKLFNTVHNIKTTPYIFTMNDTTATPRFELTVCADLTTGLNDNNSSTAAGLNESIIIKEDANGVYVNLDFDKATKTKISVTNILGQKIVENKFVTAQQESVFFGLEAKNQVIFVTVETDNNRVTKKVIH